MSEEIRISTPYDFYMEYYDPEFHTKDNFKFPSKLVFNALRCSIIDIISFPPYIIWENIFIKA